MCLGQIHEFRGDPTEILLDEFELGERVAAVRVETGRDDDQIGPERVDARQDRGRQRLTELLAVGAG